MSRVRFIDYTGEYPNLCSGELKLWIEGLTLPFQEELWKAVERLTCVTATLSELRGKSIYRHS